MGRAGEAGGGAMNVRSWDFMVAGALLLMACDRSASNARPTAAPSEGATAEGAVAVAFLEASAAGPAEDEAYAAARRQLARALLGDPAWLDIVPIDIHDRDRDVFAMETLADGTSRATLGLSRARAAEILSAFTETELRIECPSAWRETLHTFVLAHVAATACERRRSLFDSNCEPSDTTEVDSALHELASGLTLTPSHLGGVPLDAERRALRPPGTYVYWQGVPADQLPLVARWRGGSEPMPVRSDARGHAVVGLPEGAPWPGAMAITVDTRALLGPLHAAFPESTVAIDGRPADLRRWGAVVVERGESRGSTSGSVLEGMAEHLRQRNLGAPIEIPQTHAHTIALGFAHARGQDLRQPLMALADALGGRVDVLFVVEVHTRFANRMGGARVWYEARGELEAYETWSGRLLTSVGTTATASGLDNDRADEAARRALGQALAKEVLQRPEVPKPPGAEPVAAMQGASRAHSTKVE